MFVIPSRKFLTVYHMRINQPWWIWRGIFLKDELETIFKLHFTLKLCCYQIAQRHNQQKMKGAVSGKR